MKIAIHHNIGSFSDRWIEYCIAHNIEFVIIDAYSSNIIKELEDFDYFLWHWTHTDYRDLLFARQLIQSLEQNGVKVFPNVKTCWHFDDKVGQKYLLEALGVPLIRSYVFYTKDSAKSWVNSTIFPKVFKLRGGAGSVNVKLVESRREANNLIKIAFGKGFTSKNLKSRIKDALIKFNKDKSLKNFGRIVFRLKELIVPNLLNKMGPRQKGYIYFQDFIKNNNFDIRIVVIGDKCFGLKRLTRDGDFRASGSGKIIYDHSLIDINAIKVAFETTSKLDVQCCAFDFVFDEDNQPLIIEISFGFSPYSYDSCDGYWDSSLKWYNSKFNPQFWMIENLINI
ncbi:hypothetical protein GCM10027566_06660 [Arachidicoccus ginsenosidivorans]|uniref:ATP-grasp fold RimK-type domain-containing protein n=1 Tax=Arachidicoccus ginsenosidivorans TaxID=496057 RepID=A0A5B8VQR3_9BACT|nr:hypothetical protein [Arachidicoccus ginsenosidivorans]QEC73957.1 hypothetical protein FSB73_22080 [Arachidicoccus ginsenosidivorans]